MRHVEKALKAMTPEITHEYMAHNFIKIDSFVYTILRFRVHISYIMYAISDFYKHNATH